MMEHTDGSLDHVAIEDDTDLEDWKQNDLVYITLPESSHLEESTRCLIRRSALKDILSTSTFPERPRYPSNVCFRIGSSSHGLGMFATQDLAMGDHILTERPLTVTPTTIPVPHFASQLDSQGITGDARRDAILLKWERTYLRPCFERLSPDQQETFLNLVHGSQDDGSRPVLGVVAINGFELTGVVDPGPHTGGYAAVCKTMSRINHSCSPSADRFFDICSFSFQLRATRPIKTGEEIFISYCNLLESASSRQAYLASYGFTCTCQSCLPPTFLSDAYRIALQASILAIDADFDAWLTNPLLADDHMIKVSLRWIRVIKKEGLEATHAYKHHLHALVRAYVALGDVEGAMKYGRILGGWELEQSKRDDILRKMESLEYLRGHSDWCKRNFEQSC